MPPAFFVTRK